LTGVVLYAMLGVMTVRQATGAGEAVNRIPLAAAALGLLWNIGALVIYGLNDFAGTQAPSLLVGLAFAALGFLPAVAVHSASRPLHASRRLRYIVAAAYGVSGIAALLQLASSLGGVAPSREGLLLLTITYAVILVLLAWASRTRPGWQRGVSTVALAAFAVSALHLSHDMSRPDSWFVALIGHHASLPLVMVILYQDYRFAFADLFLRRALTLVVLVGLAVVLHVTIATPLMSRMNSSGRESLLATIAHVALWVATALAYPLVRRMVGYIVDRVILRREDYRHVRDDIAIAVSLVDTAEEILRRTCDVLAGALGANSVRWQTDVGASPVRHARLFSPQDARTHAIVRVPTADAPTYAIEVTGLAGGRRLMSDDLLLLESATLLAGRRIDSVRVTQERFARDLREREMLQLTAEAELRALRAQLNPHFLFNALTTVGYLVKTAPERALGALYRLTDLLRAVLRRPAGELVTLGEELEIVEAYLAIERERFQDRLTVVVDVPEDLRQQLVPPLLLQPLVENALKHGIAPLRRGGTVTVVARTDMTTDSSLLSITVTDSGVGLDARVLETRRADGLGLVNIEARIERLFGTRGALRLSAAQGGGTSAELRLPVSGSGRGEKARTPRPAA
jgi:hypothetical protein